ncbi:MAG: pgl [Alphaproteobacteria bacterium]|nr:pgl [Alphaproteobacteria bacterium]
MTEIEWWEFDSAAEMADQAAGDIGFVIESALEAHGGARLAVSGGATVDLIVRQLLRNKLDWSKVTVIPTDDRLVALDDPQSQFGRLEALFAGTPADLVSLIDEAALGDYGEAGRLADARLARLDGPLDLACLVMDANGHVAGLLPGPDLDRALSGPRERHAVGVRPDPLPGEAAAARVTLTAAALSAARAVMVVLHGEENKQKLERAIEDGPLSMSPVGRLLAELETPIDIFWSAE